MNNEQVITGIKLISGQLITTTDTYYFEKNATAMRFSNDGKMIYIIDCDGDLIEGFFTHVVASIQYHKNA